MNQSVERMHGEEEGLAQSLSFRKREDPPNADIIFWMW
jgi:hypothetical protein